MEKKLLFGIGALLALTYATFKFLTRPPEKLQTIELTKKIIKQIKYQMLIVCIGFVNQVKKRKGMEKLKQTKTENFLRQQIAREYQINQNKVLNKYQVTTKDYQISLEQYKNDKYIQECIKSIIQMMENVLHGRIPDITIPEQVKRYFSQQQTQQIYIQLCQKIIKRVLNKLKQQKKKNQFFDSRDDDSFRTAIRSLYIYDFKVEFFKEKGFKQQWGCPNQIFFKLNQNYKLSEQYKKQAQKVQKIYEELIKDASNRYQQMTDQTVQQTFQRQLKKINLFKKNQKLEQKKQIIQQKQQAINVLGSYRQQLQQPLQKDSKLRKTNSIVFKQETNNEEVQFVVAEDIIQISKEKVSQIIQNNQTKINQDKAVEDSIKVQEPVKVEEPIKVQEPIKVEEPVKVEEPIKVQEPIKVEEPVKAQEPAKIEQAPKVEESEKLQQAPKIELIEKHEQIRPEELVQSHQDQNNEQKPKQQQIKTKIE